MARGFDSKSVADQQDELQRRREGTPSRNAPVSTKRRQLELARLDVVHRLETSTDERYRASLQQALAALDEQLQGLPPEEPD
jgi:hypothetical protein